jgi:hypothetical protein
MTAHDAAKIAVVSPSIIPHTGWRRFSSLGDGSMTARQEAK